MYTDQDLAGARAAGAIDEPNYRSLTTYLAALRSAPVPAHPARPVAAPPRFDLTHLLWYAGALIIMTAMGVFTNEAFNALGGFALAGIGAAYAVGFLILGNRLWHGKDLTTPGGLAITVAVAMVPMIVYGVQDGLDLWKYAQGDPGKYRNVFPYIHGSWIWMEIATVVAAATALLFWPFPFIVMPAAVALWFLSMDIVVWLKGLDTFEMRSTVSMVFGLVTILVAWGVDLKQRGRGDFAFWLHLFGLMTFWGGLTSQSSDSEIGKLIYCGINVGLLLLAVYLDRRVYAVAGTIGVAIYLGHLASKVFRDLLSFSFALSLLGLAIIALGIWYHRNRERIAARLDASLPPMLKALRPVHG